MSVESTPAKNKIGVVIMAFGGPDSLDAVGPFMERLIHGRVPSPELIERVKGKYRLIGGKSPLPEITKKQAEALEVELNRTCSDYGEFKTYVGMRYWHPFIEEAIETMGKDGITRAFAISMSPHASRVSTGAYRDEINRVCGGAGFAFSVDMVEGMYDNPIFVDAVAQKINEALMRIPEDERDDVQVVFSAHSLPVAYIESGDPYVDEIDETIRAVLTKTGPLRWRVAYQSKGTIPGEWLSPMVEDVLADIAAEGHARVLVVPIGFAADHVETLWDLDILHKKQAEELGLVYERSDALNDSPRFMEALAQMVKDALSK